MPFPCIPDPGRAGKAELVPGRADPAGVLRHLDLRIQRDLDGRRSDRLQEDESDAEGRKERAYLVERPDGPSVDDDVRTRVQHRLEGSPRPSQIDDFEDRRMGDSHGDGMIAGRAPLHGYGGGDVVPDETEGEERQ